MQTVVLDFEFKTMGAGWPHLVDGAEPYPERLVLRQVRSLDPGLRPMPDDAIALPIPRDVLMRAALVETVTCARRRRTGVGIEVLTDPLLAPDMGHAERAVGHRFAGRRRRMRRAVHYSSYRQALVGMVHNGDAFVIVG